MAPTNLLGDLSDEMILDTSVVINLFATGHAVEIFQALPQVVITQIVLDELKEGEIRGRTEALHVAALARAGKIRIRDLTAGSERAFERLVVGTASETLDDGEAATIAFAAVDAEARAIVVVDERKAARICAKNFPALKVAGTTDILAHPAIEATLGRDKLCDAALSALQIARMRVQPHHLRWIVDLVGLENAGTCPSLPLSARLGKFV